MTEFDVITGNHINYKPKPKLRECKECGGGIPRSVHGTNPYCSDICGSIGRKKINALKSRKFRANKLAERLANANKKP